MRCLKIGYAATLLILSIPIGDVQAQQIDEGPYTSYSISGYPVHCNTSSGQRVPIYISYSMNNVGMATKGGSNPFIIFNPNILSQFSPVVQIWWFAHECGHTMLGPYHTESQADCFAGAELRRKGVLQHPAQLNGFLAEMANLPYGGEHLPGAYRVQTIASCAFG